MIGRKLSMVNIQTFRSAKNDAEREARHEAALVRLNPQICRSLDAVGQEFVAGGKISVLSKVFAEFSIFLNALQC